MNNIDVEILQALSESSGPDGNLMITGVADGMESLVLAALTRAQAARSGGAGAYVLYIAADDKRMAAVAEALKLVGSGLKVIPFPAWDCMPYDRVSPNPAIAASRIASLARMIASEKWREPVVVLTTVNAALQRLPTRRFIRASIMQLKPGNVIEMEKITSHLEKTGFRRTGTVMEQGEYALRGGIIDVFPAGRQNPVRLDFFGDTLESIRSFDPESQRTRRNIPRQILLPVSETPLGEDVISRFRTRYVGQFGAVTASDPLYEAISSGARYEGMEHWLPFFHDGLDTLFDYLPGNTLICLDHLAENARQRREEQISDHYDAREQALEQKSFGAASYHPIPPEMLFLTTDDWSEIFTRHAVYQFSPFEMPAGSSTIPTMSLKARQGRKFTAERNSEVENVFDAVVAHIANLRERNIRPIIACWSNGARERLAHLLEEHGLTGIGKIESWSELDELPKQVTAFVRLGIESGFETPDFAVIGEQDILGDRLVRPRRKARTGADVLTEASMIAVGDLVVHADHGIGRFEGLTTVTADGAPHDCLHLVYHGGDILYLPVVNIELLSRYGSDETHAALDRLGGVAWQTRKARLKKRIREIADKLIKIAAMRELRTAPRLSAGDGEYEEFCARFPYEETEDQQTSIDDVLEDLERGRPMDRLICGDVGFGKTEVALRSAYIACMAGKQVAVVVPTTLLARQHYQTFCERFKGYPINIGHASRLVSAKELAAVKAGMKSGHIDLVIGTHALLGKAIEFKDLGLLIIDEEQHFGVQHKERIKEMREDVHVLTLTATPIPRTLQLSLSGVRDLSIIATPPIDRLAVRTFITPFDPVTIREALLRERFRGGQSFYVCPRIKDLPHAAEFLEEHVPEVKFATAHGRMPPGRLEDVMTAFYDRQYDVLLSTTIVESGLDVPTANTLIVHRSEMFGLAQLYQLRGRVGRAKTRAYALFTIPAGKTLTPTAEKRLKVLQSLDTLGAGFTLASHDLDIRGAGNLLGEEQSGHIKEVGFELYQSMLEEAVASLKGGDQALLEDQWSPQISIGTSVLIPESYVTDLQVRLGLYRRLSRIEDAQEIDAFAAELQDRFGALPDEVGHLLDIVQIKSLCRRAGVEKIDAGPRGAVISFRNNRFANPDALLSLIAKFSDRFKIQPDHKLVYMAEWTKETRRLKGAGAIVRQLADLAGKAKKAA